MLRNFFNYLLLNFLFHVPMVCIRWSQRYVNNNTGSFLVYLFYTFVSTRRSFGKQKVQLSLRNQQKEVVNVYLSGDGMGFNDMMMGIMVTSDYCLKKGVGHKIYRKEPFDLERYFVPATYDWRVVESDFSGEKCDELFFEVGFLTKHPELELRLLDILCSVYSVKHVCVSLAAPCTTSFMTSKFHTVFKCSPYLSALTTNITSAMNPEGWISVTFRFMNLLGDSDEQVLDKQALSVERQKILCSKCVAKLIELKTSNDGYSIFVTSDSPIFLKCISECKIDDVFFVEGDGFHHHIGKGAKGSDKSYDKMFCEYIMIANAVRAYQIKSEDMYKSGFPQWAAAINNVPYQLITI